MYSFSAHPSTMYRFSAHHFSMYRFSAYPAGTYRPDRYVHAWSGCIRADVDFLLQHKRQAASLEQRLRTRVPLTDIIIPTECAGRIPGKTQLVCWLSAQVISQELYICSHNVGAQKSRRLLTHSQEMVEGSQTAND